MAHIVMMPSTTVGDRNTIGYLISEIELRTLVYGTLPNKAHR